MCLLNFNASNQRDFSAASSFVLWFCTWLQMLCNLSSKRVLLRCPVSACSITCLAILSLPPQQDILSPYVSHHLGVLIHERTTSDALASIAAAAQLVMLQLQGAQCSS